MKKNNEDLFVTEISESDFRKLNILAYERDRYGWKEVKLNEVLDENLKCMLKQGYKDDLEAFSCPFTFAIHKANAEDPDDFYLDKFMNQFSGPRTYQIGIGIKHLYSTRDYYEAHEDYWKVFKRETKAIYRVHLDKKWAKMFVLKHDTKKMPWNSVYDSGSDSENWELWISYDLDEENDKWVERSRYKVIHDPKYGSHFHIPVDENGEEIKHK